MSSISCSLELSGFYINGQRTSVVIAEDIAFYDPTRHQAVMIPVDLSLQASLDFSEAKELARRIEVHGGKVVWNLQLDLQGNCLFEGIFNAHYHALKTLTQSLLMPFQNQTLGCCLFQGESDLTTRVSWNEGHHQNFLEWLTDLYETPEHLFECAPGQTPIGDMKTFQKLPLEMFDITPFCRHLIDVHRMNTFAAYLHRLAAALAEDVFVFVCFDARSITHPAHLYQLFSKERFSYLNLAIKGASLPLEALVWQEGLIYSSPMQEPKLGLCFPNDPYCLPSVLHQLRTLCHHLNTLKIPYRIIPEFLMTSSWEGIDEVIFIHKALSPQGKRILQGFSITGGRLIYLDTPIGFEEEVSYTTWCYSKS